MQSGIFFSYRNKCDFCGRDHKDNCEFSYPEDCKTLRDLVSKKKDENRKLVIVVHWRNNPPAKIEMIEKP
jgi:hypothetical protein